MKNHLILLTGIILALQSCIRTEEIGSPWLPEPQPVVFSVLSSDRTPGVYLSKTWHPATSDSLLPYPDAQVFITVDEHSPVELKRESADSKYFVDAENKIQLHSGAVCKLKILLGNEEVTATTRIPEESGQIVSTRCVLAPVAPNVSIGWNDQEVLKATITATLKLPSDPATGTYLFPNYYGYSAAVFQRSEQFIMQDFYVPVDSTEFLLTIRTVDAPLKKYIIANSFSIDYDDEFLPEILVGTFSGVLPKYDNINGGTGFFGSYSEQTVTVQVEK